MLSLMRLLIAAGAAAAEATGDGCRVGCPLALASYYFSGVSSLAFIASLFGIADHRALLPYNPAIANPDNIPIGTRINVPFPCSCLAVPAAPTSTFLAGSLPYQVFPGVTYDEVSANFAGLTTIDWLMETNAYPDYSMPVGATINVTVNCSCGDESVSGRYGLFLTYPLWDGETLASVAAQYGFSSPAQMKLLGRYNSGKGGGMVFIPVKDPNGSYHPLEPGLSLSVISLSGNNLSIGAIAGIVISSVIVSIVGIWLFVLVYRRQRVIKALSFLSPEETLQLGKASKAKDKVDKFKKFSYEELFNATQGFSTGHKIGQGGFSSVYYAELRGQKAAIKKMNTQATQEFFVELKVLTHVHHLSLVHLIGYCVESCLFLVYEFIENGNLSQHLRGTGYEPLSWADRVQVALDSARGLEYIHEHTVPVYVHRDIKSANILIDKEFQAKVADFGLSKLTKVGSVSIPSRLVGTFGYMPPEYARHGHVSPKVDVYAFGVVLYELLSAKEVVGRSIESTGYATTLVYLFEAALNKPDPKEALQELVDPNLRGDYPIDSVLKIAELAKSCTHEEPDMRPAMRSVVIALMALSSKSEPGDTSRSLSIESQDVVE